MDLIEIFTIIILKIDLKKVKLSQAAEYDCLRQQIGINIDTALSGSRAGQWIGGRLKNKKIYLFFRVSDPQKAKKYILRLLRRFDILHEAEFRLKEKKIKYKNYTFV
jgi:hypothetical protein